MTGSELVQLHKITWAVYSTNIHFVSTYPIVSTSHESLEINEIKKR